jgi:hypothetical protein
MGDTKKEPLKKKQKPTPKTPKKQKIKIALQNKKINIFKFKNKTILPL